MHCLLARTLLQFLSNGVHEFTAPVRRCTRSLGPLGMGPGSGRHASSGPLRSKAPRRQEPPGLLCGLDVLCTRIGVHG